MATKTTRIPQGLTLCLQYTWPISMTTQTVNTVIKTQFIGFPGVIQKAFRLSLETNDKNEVVKVCCYVNSVELGRLGYKATAAIFAQNKVSVRFHELMEIGDEEATVFFRWDSQLLLATGNHILVFRLFLVGSMDQYSLSRFDSLLCQKLWTAAVQNKTTDVNFRIFDSTFSAHKFVLAARSPVFRAMFDTDMVESRTGEVKIVDVEDCDIFEEFLHFLYTGQLSKPPSKQLGMLAEKYQVDTLVSLCRTTLTNEKVFNDSLLALVTKGKTYPLLNGRRELTSPPGTQAQPTEPVVLHTQSFTVRDLDCSALMDKPAQAIPNTRYLFKFESTGESNVSVLNFYCSWATVLTLRTSAVDLLMFKGDLVVMKAVMGPLFDPVRNAKQPFQVFSARMKDFNSIGPSFHLRFVVHRVSTTKSNVVHYQLRDSLHAEQLWSSAVDKERTDVEFVVDGKTFPAHLAILAARCPALAALVPSDSLTPSSGPAKVEMPNMDAAVFHRLLYFIYTGSVLGKGPHPSSYLDAARMFELDTLIHLGQMGGNLPELDQDELSDVLLSLLC